MLGSSFKFVGTVLAISSMLGTSVLAYLPPINFDGVDYVSLTLVHHESGGQYAGWELVDGTAQVSASGDGYNGGKALEIPASAADPAHLRREIPWSPTEEIAFIDFRTKPSTNPVGSEAGFYANGAQFAFQKSPDGLTGEVWVYDGNDGSLDPANDPEEWLQTAGGFNLNSAKTTADQYLRVTLRQDTLRNVWDLFVDGKLVAANLRFDGREPLLDTIHFFGGDGTGGDTLIDDLSADPANMLFPDSDKDGLPNAWETANGSNPNLYDRDNISPNGKSWLERYVDSLWGAEEGTYGGPSGTAPDPGTIPPLTILGLHEPVGALKGSLAVAGDGSASYSIPIDIPKGTAGMEPQISLNYSSNGGNGLLGVGWSIGGLQRITRGPATAAKDGAFDPLDFDSVGKDRYFLDGERLVCVQGSYGVPGSEYRTEVDSFARIRYHSNDSWTIETKAGLIVELGVEPDTKETVNYTNSLGEPMVGTLSWSVNLVRDTLGNYYSVEYQKSYQTERSFLTGVHKLANGSSNLAIPPTVFTYDSLQQGQAIWADAGDDCFPAYGNNWDATSQVNSLVTVEEGGLGRLA